MKDPRNVWHEEEQDLVRVRREIQAVLTVIPLLVDDPPTSDVVHEVLLAFSQALATVQARHPAGIVCR
jgi:hypothetical protein